MNRMSISSSSRYLQRGIATLTLFICSYALADSSNTTISNKKLQQLAVAETMVDAFYSFKSEPLAKLLANAGESKARILFYQGWAEGGNYIIQKRHGCKRIESNKIDCSITVQDDLVLALGIDFDVTDVFHIEFDGQQIVAVKTSSNDPQLYLDASKWVEESYPAKISKSCKGTEEQTASPKQCARDMLSGYVEYAQLNKLTARIPSAL